MVATSLALSLIKNNPSVQLLDCDVEEPNVHLFLDQEPINETTVSLPIPKINEDLCQDCGKCTEICRFNAITLLKDTILIFPDVCHSCSACWHFCPTGALEPSPREVGTVQISQSGKLKLITGPLKPRRPSRALGVIKTVGGPLI